MVPSLLFLLITLFVTSVNWDCSPFVLSISVIRTFIIVFFSSCVICQVFFHPLFLVFHRRQYVCIETFVWLPFFKRLNVLEGSSFKSDKNIIHSCYFLFLWGNSFYLDYAYSSTEKCCIWKEVVSVFLWTKLWASPLYFTFSWCFLCSSTRLCLDVDLCEFQVHAFSICSISPMHNFFCRLKSKYSSSTAAKGPVSIFIS